MKTSVIAVLVALLLATSAFALDRRSVIIVIDAESGKALIPEGTPVPEGIVVHNAAGKALEFATAPEERFAEARKTITATSALAPLVPFVHREKGAAPLALPKINSRFGLHSELTESQTTYYVYFYDGSYISAFKWIRDVSPYGWQFFVQTGGYTPENDWYSGWIYVEQSSADHPGYNTTAYCTVNSAGGSCSTGLYGYQDNDTFTAHVTSSGNIHHHRLPICGRYGEPPCDENLSGSIEIYFP